MGKRILVIDDETMILDAVKLIFEDLGHGVTTHSDPAAGVQEAVASDYNLIMVDVRMPGMNGAEVTRSILKERPNAKILIITGYPADPLASEALEAGALALLRKPFEIAKVLDFLGEA